MNNFKITNDTDKIKIELFGAVGSSWFDEGITIDSIKNTLNDAKGKAIDINISSLGGDLNEALIIHDVLKMHNGNIDINIIGATASSGTVIAMAATNKPKISKNALFLIHNAMSVSMSPENAKEKRKAAENLDRFDGILSAMFAKVTGKRKSQILTLMEEERWLNADEAKEFGFVSAVFEPSTINNQLFLNQVNEINNSKYLPKINNQMAEAKDPEKDKGIVAEIKEFFNGKSVDVSADTKTAFVNEIKGLKQNVTEKETKIVDLEKSLTDKDAEIVTLNEKLTGFENSITEKDTEIAKLRTEANKKNTTETPKNKADKSKNVELSAWAIEAKKHNS